MIQKEGRNLVQTIAMLLHELLFQDIPGDFEINSTIRESGKVILNVSCTQVKNTCPDCNVHSTRLHSYYFRKVKDLPILGYSIVLTLRVGKFYCKNSKCSRKVFAQRFPVHFLPYKRNTIRLDDKLLKIALLMGGNPGKRLCDTLNIETSSSSLIRHIYKKDINVPTASSHIGIDDWAYKKGHTYGTAIIDLKNRKIIDLLPDREASSVEMWLRAQSNIKIVTRDRYVKYANGIKNGAPTAIQIADRWHLLKNMGDAVKKFLERKRQQLRREEIACAEKAKIERIEPDKNQLLTEHTIVTERSSKLCEIKHLYALGTPCSRQATVHRNRQLRM